jgi:membrane protease YdiL (CAAX protease family)
VLFCSALVAVLFVGVQFTIMAIALAAELAAEPSLEVAEWAGRVDTNGFLLSLASLGSAAVCVPFIRLLTGRREPEPWRFLALRGVGVRSMAVWILWMVALLIASDALTLAIGEPLVPDFMVQAYASSRHPAILLTALLVAAPLFEEIFFRGFLLSGFTSAGVSPIAAAFVSSLAWSAIHMQYDLYGMATILVMGLVLCAARFKTGSIVPCLVMHALANVVSFSETAILACSTGG